MYINFGAKLKVDNTIYKNLKYTDANKLVEATQEVISSEKMTKLLGADEVSIKANKFGRGDCIDVVCGEKEFSVSNSMGGIHPFSIAHCLLIWACCKNGQKIRHSDPKHLLELISNIKLKD